MNGDVAGQSRPNKTAVIINCRQRIADETSHGRVGGLQAGRFSQKCQGQRMQMGVGDGTPPSELGIPRQRHRVGRRQSRHLA